MDLPIVTYLGAFLVFVWGVSHLMPTRNVVRGFGEISADNRRIIMMEWITEGVCLIFIGIMVAVVTSLDPASSVSRAVYWVSFVFLNVLSFVSLFTAFRNSFLPFKLCPLMFTGSSVLIMIGS